MHDNMMMADVGGIEKVSGSKIATPLAPPSPGSTPMMTPNRMPIIIRKTLYQLSATAKPPNSEAISSTACLFLGRFHWVALCLTRRRRRRHHPCLVYHVPINPTAQHSLWRKLPPHFCESLAASDFPAKRVRLVQAEARGVWYTRNHG